MDYDALWERSQFLFQIKLLQDRIDAFESGEKYQRMIEEHRKTHAAEIRTINKLKQEIEKVHKNEAHTRDIWYETCLEIMKERDRQLAEKDREIERLKNELKKSYTIIQEEHEKALKRLQERNEYKDKYNDEREKNQALMAQKNKDFSNSSKSSSMAPNHKIIKNSREKSGKKPGGQRGHVHHGRKAKKPTVVFDIPAPEEYVANDNYKLTGKIITKQLIKLRIISEVIEYRSPEFRNLTTGQRVHAQFPKGVIDDVNYDGSVKAFIYLLNNELYASIEKTRKFLKDVSHGDIDVSSGFVCNLSGKFSKLTKEEREAIFESLANAPNLHADFTFGRVNGKQTAVMVTTDGQNILFQGRRKKGDEGVKDTPVDGYEGTLISDHEAAIIKHGSINQECLAHVERYAKGSAENEPTKTWSTKLVKWIKEAIGWRNDVCEDKTKYTRSKAEQYIKELQEILDLAYLEYECEPPSKYYREGYNLYKRMSENLDDYVLFLRDLSVPPTNNNAERAGRKVKRKMHQVMSFRSEAGVDYFCDGLSILESIKAHDVNVFDEVAMRFNKNQMA